MKNSSALRRPKSVARVGVQTFLQTAIRTETRMHAPSTRIIESNPGLTAIHLTPSQIRSRSRPERGLAGRETVPGRRAGVLVDGDSGLMGETM